MVWLFWLKDVCIVTKLLIYIICCCWILVLLRHALVASYFFCTSVTRLGLYYESITYGSNGANTRIIIGIFFQRTSVILKIFCITCKSLWSCENIGANFSVTRSYYCCLKNNSKLPLTNTVTLTNRKRGKLLVGGLRRFDCVLLDEDLNVIM